MSLSQTQLYTYVYKAIRYISQRVFTKADIQNKSRDT